MQDIGIIGGGAAGLCAAIHAARLGAGVTILERLPRVGKKLLVTGSGRCNLGNLDPEPRLNGSVSQAGNIVAGFDTVGFFRSVGLYCRPDNEGRLYPMSNQASSVLDALRQECNRLGVREECSFCVSEIEVGCEEFILRSEGGKSASCRRLIIAAGGRAAPAYGTDGLGLRLAESLGHSSTYLLPSLCPLPSGHRFLKMLAGQRVRAAVTALKNSIPVAFSKGEVQFTKDSLSGICVFDLARFSPDIISLDLLPEQSKDVTSLLKILFDIRGLSEDALGGLFPKRVSAALMRESGGDVFKLARLIKDWRFSVTEPSSWDKAQVTAGGIPGSEVTENLESKLIHGLYFCGEVLDADGPCGGYNLRWAWASGAVAGGKAAQCL
ncbi:MAG: aminoacetone oxidase family FAD-binding enzyme [Oscillospiraceae bacterium]|jgi:predicted Rossmann fold flavoprotein